MSARRSARSRPALVAALVAAATIAAPMHGAVAQPVGAAERRARAGQLTDEGLAAYRAGDGARALAAFRAAYDLVPENDLLLNLGLAAELAGQATTAIDYFERFLAVEARDPRAPDVHDRIAALRAQLAATEARRREEEAARQAALDRAAQDALRRDDEFRARQAREREEAARRADDARAQAAIDGRGRGLRIGGLVVAGAGLASFGAAAYFGARARALSDELSAHGALYNPAKVRAGLAADRNLIIGLVAGGVLVGTGVTMHVIGRRQRARARVTVAVDGERLGLVWAGSF